MTLTIIIVGCSKNDDIEGGNNPSNDPTKESQISLNATIAEFTNEGGTTEVSFTTSGTWMVSVNSDGSDWCSVSPTNGTAGAAKISITTTANNSIEKRTTVVVIKSGTNKKDITVSQKQKDTVMIAEDRYTVKGEGGEIKIEVNHNVEFDIQINDDWITQHQTRNLETSVLTFVIEKNDTDAERSGSITFISKDGATLQTISIIQNIAIITELYYTSTDGQIVTPYGTNWGGAKIVSNTYNDGKGIITFEGEVTSIGEKAFYDCTSLTSITIPEYITSIGEQAFAGCHSLSAFYGKYASDDNRCLIVDGELKAFASSELYTYDIPNGISSIGNTAFLACMSLKNINIPNSVISIGHSAFLGCLSLESINIPSGLTEIEDKTFAGCYQLKDILIPIGVTSIGNNAFENCSALTNIDIPASVLSIGNNTFANCSSLSSIDMPEGVITIGKSAFYSCYTLTNITIPNSVTSIGVNAFNGCI